MKPSETAICDWVEQDVATPRLRRQKIVLGILAGLVMGYAVILAFEVMLLPLDCFDESIQVLGARAVNAGLLPHVHRDEFLRAANLYRLRGITALRQYGFALS